MTIKLAGLTKMNSSTLIFLLLPTFALIVSPSLAQQCSDYSEFCWVCSNDTGSTVYKKNLKHLISTFPSSSNNGLNVYGFYNSSFGENSNTVNAIALCRGDLSTEICQSCVHNSCQRLLESCPNRREGIIWDKLCMVRYSNNSIFSVRHDVPRMYVPSPNDAQEPNPFKITLKQLLNSLISRASSGDSLRKYASGKSTVLGYNTTIYATVQCTPDLDKQECNGCLQEAAVFISQQSSAKQGARVLKPSCNLRYEVASFFEATNDSPVSPSNSSEKVENAKKRNSSVIKIGKMTVLLCSVFLFLVVLAAYWRAKTKKRAEQRPRQYLNTHTICSIYSEDRPGKKGLSEGRNNSDIPLFDLKTIAAATCNFSVDNKLGEGGFGSVYKGMLPNGEEIAVKRLSKYSGQGIEEFRNEVRLIAKLQHRNLVGILGCCVQDEEKMLIYEYLPNRSLDSFIFDETKKHVLNWRTRFNIICGVARGLLYLHQDSKLRIIHRDLKSSNVLLDATMNPKIADFGLSRIFSGDQIEASTSRVVGTCGYMSPEYAMEGLFSIKSDVYSFGVLVLEIITGKKNTGYYHEKPDSNLVGHVWDLWTEDKASQVVDRFLDESFVDEALRCIQIGLLCVEEHAIDRPIMSNVVSMLGNDLALPSPKQPAFVLKEGTSLLESHQLGDQELTL